MRTLKVENNDFVLTSGRLTVLTGTEALAQIIRNRLRMWKGEWFATPLSGIDYLTLNSQKTRIEERARTTFRKAIMADSRITQITKLDVSLNRSTRELTVDFVAESTEGLIEGSA